MGGSSPATSYNQSTSHGYSRPLSERTHPAQWALYGPAAAMLSEKAFGGARDKQITETGLRNQAFTNSVGAAQRLGNTMASQGIGASSPLYAAMNRGLQTNLVDNLSGASAQAEQAQRATQADYAKTLASYLGNWPPSESYSNSQSTGTSQQPASSGGK
jgi:hypothetical protein